MRFFSSVWSDDSCALASSRQRLGPHVLALCSASYGAAGLAWPGLALAVGRDGVAGSRVRARRALLAWMDGV